MPSQSLLTLVKVVAQKKLMSVIVQGCVLLLINSILNLQEEGMCYYCFQKKTGASFSFRGAIYVHIEKITNKANSIPVTLSSLLIIQQSLKTKREGSHKRPVDLLHRLTHSQHDSTTTGRAAT